MQLNADYEKDVMAKNAPEGKSFLECCDEKTLTPSKEYLTLWEKKKKQLSKMGLNI